MTETGTEQWAAAVINMAMIYGKVVDRLSVVGYQRLDYCKQSLMGRSG